MSQWQTPVCSSNIAWRMFARLFCTCSICSVHRFVPRRHLLKCSRQCLLYAVGKSDSLPGICIGILSGTQAGTSAHMRPHKRIAACNKQHCILQFSSTVSQNCLGNHTVSCLDKFVVFFQDAIGRAEDKQTIAALKVACW